MSRKKLIPVYRIEDVPHFASDKEAAEFWDTHHITEEYAAEARAQGLIPERPAERLARLRSQRKQQVESISENTPTRPTIH